MSIQEIHQNIVNRKPQIAKSIKEIGYTPDPELDEWETFDDMIDLNFCTENGQVQCYAYPVVNGLTQTNPEFIVKIT
jgi:hypothetical protein